MAAINVMGLGIERDLYWTPRRLSEVRREVNQNKSIHFLGSDVRIKNLKQHPEVKILAWPLFTWEQFGGP
jgi:hypothetical protein